MQVKLLQMEGHTSQYRCRGTPRKTDEGAHLVERMEGDTPRRTDGEATPRNYRS